MMPKPGQTQKVVLIITARVIDIYREIEVVKTRIIKNYVFSMEVTLSWVDDHKEKCTKKITQESPDL